MKKRFVQLILFIIISAVSVQAQSDYLWPVEGAEKGAGIIYVPQSYIDDEFNFGDLFITAPEGTTIVSPVDGVIQHISVGYAGSLKNSTSYRYYKDNFDESIKYLRNDLDKTKDLKYLSGHLSIKSDDGLVIHISGLNGSEFFKTGQKIKKGTPVGKIGYSYYKIKEPSIMIGISRNSKAADPMSPFGIKSTFIPPGEAKSILSLTKEQAKEDFLIYIGALKELYPGLYNVVTKEELDDHIGQIIFEIDSHNDNIEFRHFSDDIMYGSLCKIHDSHLQMLWPPWMEYPKQAYQAAILLGWINDTLVCTNALERHRHLIGKQITKVNGMTADSMKNIVSSYVSGYDGDVKDYTDFVLGTFGSLRLIRPPYGDGSYDMHIELVGGEVLDIKGDAVQNRSSAVLDWSKFVRINKHQNNYDLRMLNDSTAYIGISTFSLNEVQVEDIAQFIDSISDIKNLIIDVRNNGGGEGEVISQLYSYIAGDPMVLKGYSKVNKKGAFDSFKYSLNYSGVNEDIFPHYKQIEGKEGYYSYPESEASVVPDSNINYKGRVYVLTNENSISAATMFPALVVRNHRGVVVGRETRGAYHFMNAVKFAEIRLPNSTLTIRIPMVEAVFDTIENDRVPFGRGVIPDYHIPLSIEELSFEGGDAILNHTLKLIENGEYIKGNNPFYVEAAVTSSLLSGSNIILIILLLGLVIGIIVFIRMK